MSKIKENALPVPLVPQQEIPPVKIITEEPPGGTQYFHTDYIDMHWSLFDVKIRFGELVKHHAPTKGSVLWDRAVITMSWGEAKYLASVLQGAVERYEKVNGPIKTIAELKLP